MKADEARKLSDQTIYNNISDTINLYSHLGFYQITYYNYLSENVKDKLLSDGYRITTFVDKGYTINKIKW